MLVTAVAMRVGSGWQFTLNALTFVPELVNEVGSTGSTLGHASWRFFGGRGIPSSEPRMSRNMVKAFRSLSRLVPLVLFSLIIDCGCPLFLVPDNTDKK
jgi:hypothetical protein